MIPLKKYIRFHCNVDKPSGTNNINPPKVVTEYKSMDQDGTRIFYPSYRGATPGVVRTPGDNINNIVYGCEIYMRIFENDWNEEKYKSDNAKNEANAAADARKRSDASRIAYESAYSEDNMLRLFDLYLQYINETLNPEPNLYFFHNNLKLAFTVKNNVSFTLEKQSFINFKTYVEKFLENNPGFSYPGLRRMVNIQMDPSKFEEYIKTKIKERGNSQYPDFSPFDRRFFRDAFISHKYEENQLSSTVSTYKNFATNKIMYLPDFIKNVKGKNLVNKILIEEGNTILHTIQNYIKGKNNPLAYSDSDVIEGYSIIDFDSIEEDFKIYYTNGLPYGYVYDELEKKYKLQIKLSNVGEIDESLDLCPTLYTVLKIDEENFKHLIELKDDGINLLKYQGQVLQTKIGKSLLQKLSKQNGFLSNGESANLSFDLDKLTKDWSTVLNRDKKEKLILHNSDGLQFYQDMAKNGLLKNRETRQRQLGGGDRERVVDIENAVKVLSNPVKRMGYNRMIQMIGGGKGGAREMINVSRKIANVLYLCELKPVDIPIYIWEESGNITANIGTIPNVKLTDTIIDIKQKLIGIENGKFNSDQCYSIFLINLSDIGYPFVVNDLIEKKYSVLNDKGKIKFKPMDDTCTLYECNIGNDAYSNKLCVIKLAGCTEIHLKNENRKVNINTNTTINNFLYLYGNFDTNLNMKKKFIKFYSGENGENYEGRIELPEIKTNSTPEFLKQYMLDVLREKIPNYTQLGRIACEIVNVTTFDMLYNVPENNNPPVKQSLLSKSVNAVDSTGKMIGSTRRGGTMKRLRNKNRRTRKHK